MISVLMPSRGRVALAKQAVESLGTGDYEVLITIDEDDPQIKDYYKLVKDNISLTVVNRWGYGALHEYYNNLSELADGDWLMLYNDDAVMETPNWTQIISQYDHTIPQVLNVWNKEGDNLFPLISRKWYELVGHFSLNTHADSWVQQIGQRLDIQTYVPGIKITHQGENMHDQTHNEARQIVRETSANYRRMEDLRIKDANLIEEWLSENNKRV